jgi:hypothetical protein
MKRVCIDTDRFDSFRAPCHRDDFIVAAHALQGAAGAEYPPADYYVIDECPPNELAARLAAVRGRGRTLCLMKDVGPDERRALLAGGVVDVVDPDDRGNALAYVKMLDTDPAPSAGAIIVLDSDRLHHAAIGGIVTRFGYRVLFADRTDHIGDHMHKSNVQFVLINLGMDLAEVNEFVRAYATRVEMRTVPVIAYREMSQGLYIHEILRGLNRLTRFVLSIEELYSFLVDIMFRKDVIPLLDGLNYSADFKASSCYAREPLKKIYYLNEGNFFGGENILNRENMERMEGGRNLLSQAFFRVKGLRWLRSEARERNLATCGAGV